MASDNEDDDLSALREAALATLKQKVQPIENVFSGKNAVHSQDSAAWSDVPASIDFPAFSDPIPEQNHFPSPFEEPVHRPPPPQHLFRPATNLPWNQSHQHRMPPFQAQRMRHPRFPHRTFGDMGERGNRRGRPRGYLSSHAGRGGIPLGHPHHPTGMPLPPQTPLGAPTAMGNNLIVIQPHMSSRNEIVPSISAASFGQSFPVNVNSSSATRNGMMNSHSQSDNSHTRPKLVLPQDKYHSSGDSMATKVPDKEPEPEVKSKDKFSRYDKSDSEEDEDDDDASEVDDIANEIDKVLQDDFLAEEIDVQAAEEPEAADDKVEAAATDDTVETVAEKESTEDSEPASPVASEKQEIDDDVDADQIPSVAAVSDISDGESLDLDALAGGEPVIGDLEDLDSLVDKEPDSVMSTSDSKHVINDSRREGSANWNGSDRNNELRGKKDTDIRSKENAASSNKQSPLRRRSPMSPNNYHNSSSRPYTNSSSPSKRYDSYTNKTYPSPQRPRSPLYSRHSTYKRSTSPRFRSRSRSPYHRKSPIRRSSISPRRRAISPANRRLESSPRRYPVDRARRRSMSPNRKATSPSPRDRHRPAREEGRPGREEGRPGREEGRPAREEGRPAREEGRPAREEGRPAREEGRPAREEGRPGREEGRRYRDHYNSRPGDSRYRESDRYCRDRERPQPVERGRLDNQKDNQKESEAKVKNTDENKVPPVNKRISPLMEKTNPSQEKEKVNNTDLEKLTPEERARIEARRKKFDSRAEVKVAEASKKISLKDIKKREKKSKKKDEEKAKEPEDDEETLQLEEALPDVVNKKGSSKSGISLKKLRKKQESKKRRGGEEGEQESPRVVGLVDLEDDSEGDSDEGRSWRTESAGASGPTIKFGVSRTLVNKAPLVSLDSIGGGRGRKYHQDVNVNRRRFPDHQDRRNHTERERLMKGNRSRRVQNNRWSSDEDSDNGGVQASRLSSSVVTSKPSFQTDIAPEKLHIQVQIATKKKTKAVPDFSNVYSVHAKRRRVADNTNNNDEEEKDPEEIEPVKKSKKKKEKRKKHSKEENSKGSVELMDEMEMIDTISRSPANKPSVLERLGKKVSLDSLEKKEKKKKKSKKNRDVDEDTDDLDLHILKMKAKNEQIMRRQREIQLDKERYG